jgi:predicted porin
MNRFRGLIALSLLAACCVAQAQSNVTVYGKIDLGARRSPGSNVKELRTSGDSRLGFKGVEDLGDGHKAFFNIEHRLQADTGAADTPFWRGVAHVGLSGGWGQLGLGRQYTAAFSLIQNMIDPFGGDTVAALRQVGAILPGIGKLRVDGSVRYDYSANGFSGAVSVAEGDKNGGPDRAISYAAQYKSGPLLLGFGVEDPSGVNDEQWTLGGAYTFGGSSTVSAGVSRGKNNADAKVNGWLVAYNLAIGPGDFKIAYGRVEVANVVTSQKLGIGYHYKLSKRTQLYADIGNDSKLKMHKTGFDAGIRHSF